MKDYFIDNNTFLSVTTPRSKNCYSFSIGKPKTNISLSVNKRKNKISCELYLGGENKIKTFYVLLTSKDEIENEIGEELEWIAIKLDENISCKIILYNNGDIKNRNNWEDCFVWFMEKAESFHKAFSTRVKML